MESGTISEAQFLITELQYTLGQLHVQLADLDESGLGAMQCGDRTVEEVVAELTETEEKMQSKYAQLLGLDGSAEGNDAESVALPISDEDIPSTPQARFEHLRTATIEMLRGTDDRWTEEMLELVKGQVANDRARTTEIAECRKSLFTDDSRPDLEDPLTTKPEPHIFADQSAHVEETGEPDNDVQVTP